MAALWPRVSYDQGKIGLVLVPLVIMVPILRGAGLWVTRACSRSSIGALLLTLLSLLVLAATLIVLGAFLASWQNTNTVIAGWVQRLVSGTDQDLARSAARVALGFLLLLLLFLLVLSPALRGWIESAVARKSSR